MVVDRIELVAECMLDRKGVESTVVFSHTVNLREERNNRKKEVGQAPGLTNCNLGKWARPPGKAALSQGMHKKR